MSKKIVIQVDVVGDACRAKAMSSVAPVRGVKSMAFDGEKMTVIGDVDVVRVAKKLKKAMFSPVVLSVGPEKEEKKPDPPKKPDEKKPPCCPGCSCGCRTPPPPVCLPQPPPVCLPPPCPREVIYCDEPQLGCVIL
ncbi:hypothetical protein EJB05_06435 [Eragrostis curvula]|uniref:HMA domain-containing protein n=1 Tax=Eragrostis curvula TaxID=38414 RepID=A0A5J9WFP2_9POAL|nr:hypothetical protein EJB05_06435 [Eragrostis curvula]